MILESLEDRVVRRLRGTERFVPDYKGNSIVNIPHTIFRIATGRESGTELSTVHGSDRVLGDCSRIVLFYIDGFSYDAAVNFSQGEGFMRKLSSNGQISPISAVFPSTTAASCTSLSTGLTPVEHALLEWQLYFHETGALIYTLPFKPVTKHYSSRARSLDPSALFHGSSILGKVSEYGVKSYAILNRYISSGPYTERLFTGTKILTHSFVTDSIVRLRQLLENEEGPMVVYVYLETGDAVGHIYGPDTEMYRAELENIFRVIDAELLCKISSKAARNTGIFLTSDHGQVQINPDETIYLQANSDIWKAFEEHMGERIPPSGSPRDLFLHAEEGRINSSIESLTAMMSGKADIVRIEDALSEGYFGPPQLENENFRSRSGNILVLPRDNHTVWYRLKGMSHMSLRGLHGGMSRDEMLVPLGLARMEDLL